VGDFEKKRVSNIGEWTKFSIVLGMKDEFKQHRISENFGKETVDPRGGRIIGGNR
jgi:hypothetical protein